MNLKIALYYTGALFFIAQSALAVPPDPPVGKRWVLNEQFSDEFNGTSLDSSKWNNYHPNWIGRAPGLFVSSNVSVGGGYLKLKGGVLDPPQTINGSEFNISCAAVTSKEQAASYGYYECLEGAEVCHE